MRLEVLLNLNQIMCHLLTLIAPDTLWTQLIEVQEAADVQDAAILSYETYVRYLVAPLLRREKGQVASRSILKRDV